MMPSTRSCRRDSAGLPFRRHPVDLRATMAVCDANYLRIRKLLPDLGQDTRRLIGLPGNTSLVAGVVEFRVLESFRYTTTLGLRLIDSTFSHPYYQPPTMLVRLYHDACTSEVVSYQERSTAGFQTLLKESLEFKPDEKEQVNHFLAEWLTLCLDFGLGPRPAPPREAAEGVI